jgi:hypothetical protein
VNGAQGVVKKIWFNQGYNSNRHLPGVVFVELMDLKNLLGKASILGSQLYWQLQDRRLKQENF